MNSTSIALCRVSTTKQSTEGNSLEAQEKRVYEAADYVGAPIEKFWSLSVSSRKGKNFKRRDLHEMLKYAKQFKRVQFIIVDEVDRFMRSFEEFYYWKVLFREEVGARLVIASKPHLTFKDDMYSLFEEMIDVFKAEASNQERITKTTEKMQARLMAGYYPGKPKQGYRKTATPGFHEPKEPEWSLLQVAFKEVASQNYDLHEVLKRLNSKGYKTTFDSDLDMERFKSMLRDPYYAGEVRMSSWPSNPHGLHTPLISSNEHEAIQMVVIGKKKIPHKQFNPEYRLSNIIECTDCIEEGKPQKARLTGYTHNNGKAGEKRKYYGRYRCRSCKKEQSSNALHDSLNQMLGPLLLAPEKQSEFIKALRKVWELENTDNTRYIKTLQMRLNELTSDKNSLVLSIANGKTSESDGEDALVAIKESIANVASDIKDAQSIEQDFVEFVDFTMTTIRDMQQEWWNLDQKHLRWCKQLLFPEGFSVSRQGKVYTPKISEFYRLASIEKGSEEPSFSDMVTRTHKSLHLLSDEAIRWRGIIGMEYETTTFNKKRYIPSSIHT